MIIQIPIKAVPNQQIQVTLNGQQCTINLYTRNYLELQSNLTEPLIVDGTFLCIDPADRTDILLVGNDLPGVSYFNSRVYMDLYVAGQIVFAGQPVVFGSFINQFTSTLFRGYLYMNTADGLDPVYTDYGNTTTLNYTNGILSN